jgi:hypothetical protein
MLPGDARGFLCLGVPVAVGRIQGFRCSHSESCEGLLVPAPGTHQGLRHRLDREVERGGG